jgi:hypothetical protein
LVDIVRRLEADWTLEIQGFLGIINILGQEQMLVITESEEVCSLTHQLQEDRNKPTPIYELQDIEIIPFS